MNDYIINTPQLQSVQHRVSSFIVWLTCWLMWLYLLLPILTLGIWLLDENKLIPEMRWFGGYKSLLQLLEVYVGSLLMIAALWIVWVLYHSLRQHPVIAAATHRVTDEELCNYYKVTLETLHSARTTGAVTVYFDDHGQIVQIKPAL